VGKLITESKASVVIEKNGGQTSRLMSKQAGQ